ncbi:alkaline phosphatase D family protein [Methylomonas sp. MED-D]|uniref:alkaline phosphatase D family protein n=1 Tax=unclassified Methylomonas TaxID=2608980 RepID=UPI0028A4F3A8|nr:alkaline phosphatase D family protein [Methylomonas sp. MV1]MDT4329161.1 alkaline phosphatase D family protein [Methylomonas sp. MV1]
MADLKLYPGAINAEGNTYSLRLRVDGWPAHLPCKASNHLEIAPNSNNENIIGLDPIPGALGLDSHIALITGLKPNENYEIKPKFQANRDKEIIRIRTPPISLDHPEEELVIALSSCYFPSDQFVGYPIRMKNFIKNNIPHLKIFCGDQIYADVPAAFNSIAPKLLYQIRYKEAFQICRLGNLLKTGANVFTCDDHEYWNGYPEAMPYLTRSWSENKSNWAKCGQEAFWRNQGVMNMIGESPLEFERCWASYKLAGIDLFISDTRTDRTNRDSNKPHTLSAPQKLALISWINTVERIGLLVIGQPLMLRSTKFDNALEDYSLEYNELLDVLVKNINERAVSFIILTGDIHWGRLVYWVSPKNSQAKLIEFVSSPLARVGGIKSLLSTEYNVGTPEDVTLDFSEFYTYTNKLPGFMGVRAFSTNANNFGILKINKPYKNFITAGFELFNVDFPNPETAIDNWFISTNQNRCKIENLPI